MERISWKDSVTTAEVLGRVGEKRRMLDIIKGRKKSWWGTVSGKHKVIREGVVNGKRNTGRMRDQVIRMQYQDYNKYTWGLANGKRNRGRRRDQAIRMQYQDYNKYTWGMANGKRNRGRRRDQVIRMQYQDYNCLLYTSRCV